MKTNLKRIVMALFAVIAMTNYSCSSDSESSTDNTITGIASRTSNLSILVQALNKADLATTLKGAGPYTVFAPTNEAFAAFLAEKGYASLDAVPVAALKQILLNHVVSGSLQASSLSTGYLKTLAKGSASTTNTLSLYVNTTSGVKLNGVSTVVTPNVTASNGVVHIVNKVIDLPTIVTHAVANPNFSTLVSVVTSPAQASVLTAVSGSGPLTLFAPTNSAFTSLNTELAPGGIAGVSNENLTKVLLYHAVPGNILAGSLTEGQVVNTALSPQTFTIQLAGGAKIKDVNNRISNIVATDVQCSNGVIHVLDKVLLPTL